MYDGQQRPSSVLWRRSGQSGQPEFLRAGRERGLLGAGVQRHLVEHRAAEGALELGAVGRLVVGIAAAVAQVGLEDAPAFFKVVVA